MGYGTNMNNLYSRIYIPVGYLMCHFHFSSAGPWEIKLTDIDNINISKAIFR